MGRSVASRGATDDGREAGARCRARVRAGQARPADRRGISARAHRHRDLSRNGRARPSGRDDPGGVRRRRAQLCELRTHRARGRARRLGLPLDDERAVLARDAAHPCVRHGRAEATLSALARPRREHRLLRTHRAQPRLRSGQHGHARARGERWVSSDRIEDLDHQQPDRRRIRRVGENGRQRHPRVHSREGHRRV